MSLLSSNGLPIEVQYATPTATGGSPPVVIACTPPSGSTFPVGTSAVSCTATDSAQRTDACAFVVTVTSPPKLAVTRFLAYGDSMTWGEDGQVTFARLGFVGTGMNGPHFQLAFPNTYPGALQILLSARYTAQTPAVRNDGVPGEQATDPAAFARFSRDVTGGSYDVVLLMEGVNDLSGSDQSKVAGAAGALQVMVQTVKNQGLRVFLATIPPENPNASGPFNRSGNAPSVVPLNNAIRLIAATAQIPLVDVYTAFGGDLSLLSDDGLHPNAQGYQRIAETFLTTIRQNLEVAPTPQAIPLRRR